MEQKTQVWAIESQNPFCHIVYSTSTHVTSAETGVGAERGSSSRGQTGQRLSLKDHLGKYVWG